MSTSSSYKDITFGKVDCSELKELGIVYATSSLENGCIHNPMDTKYMLTKTNLLLLQVGNQARAQTLRWDLHT
jgi:hypothetical protein